MPTRSDIRRAAQVVEALRAAQPDLVLAVGGDAAARAASTTGALELPATLPDAVVAVRRALRI